MHTAGGAEGAFTPHLDWTRASSLVTLNLDGSSFSKNGVALLPNEVGTLCAHPMMVAERTYLPTCLCLTSKLCADFLLHKIGHYVPVILRQARNANSVFRPLPLDGACL